MNITHFEFTPEDQRLWESINGANQPNADTQYINSPLSSEATTDAQNAEIVTIFVNSTVDAKTIDALPNLKLLVTRSTGFDHIDIAYAQSKGIMVCNVPSYGSRTVAEFTFGLILGLSRKIFQAIEQIKQKNDWSTEQFEGFNLQGKTLGIIGTGRIGLNVAQIAKGFDMQIVAHDAFPNEQKAQELGFKYLPMDELLGSSDVITLHVPANKDTHHLINTENIANFKKGSLLINTSRGDVVDPEALLTGLRQETLAGVGLDVLEGEHELKEEATLGATHEDKLKVLLEDHILMGHPNVIITPHIAFNAKEARHDIIATTSENISNFIASTPKNIITL